MSFKKVLLASALIIASTAASALPIITGSIDFLGSISLSGTDTNGNGVDYLEADSIQLTNLLLIGGTGAYASIPANTSTIFSQINLDPITASNPLWIIDTGSASFSFEADSLQINLRTATDLLLSGSGWLKADGYEDTRGYWDFSSQSGVSFSANANVPEPGTLALFGLGLAGLGFTRRKQA